MSRGRRLTRAFFAQPTEDLARALLGCTLVHRTDEGVTAGRIVETEAYFSEGDAASHSHRGETARNRSMFGAPGTAYVYLIYGVHHCFNVVSAPRGTGEAVLLRAPEPVEGLELMRDRRGGVPDRRLCDGPGKLVQALGVCRTEDGRDLVRGTLGIWGPGSEHLEVSRGPRIGITKAENLLQRYWLADSIWVSR